MFRVNETITCEFSNGVQASFDTVTCWRIATRTFKEVAREVDFKSEKNGSEASLFQFLDILCVVVIVGTNLFY